MNWPFFFLKTTPDFRSLSKLWSNQILFGTTKSFSERCCVISSAEQGEHIRTVLGSGLVLVS